MNQELKQKLIDAGYKGEFGLSELIEACGDRFLQIQKNPELIDRKWGAFSIELDGKRWVAFGHTPEDAVASLWLELNKS